jgi:hypothetical protein
MTKFIYKIVPVYYAFHLSSSIIHCNIIDGTLHEQIVQIVGQDICYRIVFPAEVLLLSQATLTNIQTNKQTQPYPEDFASWVHFFRRQKSERGERELKGSKSAQVLCFIIHLMHLLLLLLLLLLLMLMLR